SGVWRESPPLVLLPCGGLACRERPYAVGELRRQDAVVLTSRPERSVIGIQVHLRRAPVGSAGPPLSRAHVIGAYGRRRCPGRIVVRDLLGVYRIANIEHPDSGVEISTCKRGCLLFVVHAAIMAAVHEYPESGQIRDHAVKIRNDVRLQPQLGNDFGIGFVSDVDDPGQWKRSKPSVTGNVKIGRLGKSSRSRLVDEDNIGLALDLDWYRVLGS